MSTPLENPSEAETKFVAAVVSDQRFSPFSGELSDDEGRVIFYRALSQKFDGDQANRLVGHINAGLGILNYLPPQSRRLLFNDMAHGAVQFFEEGRSEQLKVFGQYSAAGQAVPQP
jgi:hypothetical protein